MSTKGLMAIGIVCNLLLISILFFLFFDKKYECTIGSYEMEYTQNPDDYSYNIIITEEREVTQPIDNVWIHIHSEIYCSINSSLLLTDYLLTEQIPLEHSHWQDFTNLSLTITYFDNDNNERLTVGDSFTLEAKNADNMESYNFKNFDFQLYDFEQNKIIGSVDIYENK